MPSGLNRYGVGDEIAYERTDGLTGASRRFTDRVTSADDQLVVFNDGESIRTQMGGSVKNRFGRQSPAIDLTPADIALGKQWRTGFTNIRVDGVSSNSFWDFRVVALEDVSIRAGRFRAYRVVGRGEAHGDDGTFTYMTATNWIDPRTMLIVKTEILYRKNQKIVANDRTEMLDYKPAPR